MDLADALELSRAELVSFVGAGGKKTAMKRLVTEAAGRDLEVCYTTTTHMPPPPDLPLVLTDADDGGVALREPKGPLALATTHVENPERVETKVRGLEPSTLETLFRNERFDWLLVKADGARRREFKAPAEHEPAIPPASTCVVPVVSVEAVGRPLTDAVAHRVERIERCADVSRGETITPEHVGQVLADPEGGVKRVPDGARIVPLVNKAETDAARRDAAAAISTAFARSSRIDRAIACSLERGRLSVHER